MFSTSGSMGPLATTTYKRLASQIASKRDQPYNKVMAWLRCHLCFSLLRSSITAIRGVRSRTVHAARCIASVLHAGSFILQANLQSPFWKEKASTQRVPHDYAFVQQAAKYSAESVPLVFIFVPPSSSTADASKAFRPSPRKSVRSDAGGGERPLSHTLRFD